MHAARLILAACSIAVLSGCGAAPPTTTPPASAPESAAPPVTTAEQAPPDAEGKPKAKRAEKAPPKPKAIAIQAGPAKDKGVALTFDADMTPQMLAGLLAGGSKQYDKGIIRTLHREKAPATIFVTGLWAKTYPDEVRHFAKDPLLGVGNHTYDHRAWTADCYGLPAVTQTGEKKHEIGDTTAQIEKATGEAPRWFRFPGLCHSEQDVKLVARAGEQVIDGLSSADAFASDPAAVEQMVLDQVKPGSIIIMHLNGVPNAPVTGEALRAIIPALRHRGYKLVSLGSLLDGGAKG